MTQFKAGDKVKHVNTGDLIHTVRESKGNVCTLTKHISLHTKVFPTHANSVISDTMICMNKNLILIPDVQNA